MFEAVDSGGNVDFDRKGDMVEEFDGACSTVKSPYSMG